MIDRGKHNVLGIEIDAVDYEHGGRSHLSAAQGQQAVGGLGPGGARRDDRRARPGASLPAEPLRTCCARRASRCVGRSTGCTEPKLRRPRLRSAADAQACARAADQRTADLSVRRHARNCSTELSRIAARVSDIADRRHARVEVPAASPTATGELCRRDSRQRGGASRSLAWAVRARKFGYEFRCDALSMPMLAVARRSTFMAISWPGPRVHSQGHGLEWFVPPGDRAAAAVAAYLLLNPLYLSLLLLQMVGLRSFDPSDAVAPCQDCSNG